MKIKLNAIKIGFNSLRAIRKEIKILFNTCNEYLSKIKNYYQGMINNNNYDAMYLFSLDSLNFQSKIIEFELDDLKKLNIFINNRIYSEYFKLFKLITIYVNKNHDDPILLNLVNDKLFPLYKDLEPYKEYEFIYIREYNQKINEILITLLDLLLKKEIELNEYYNNNEFNISNFINTIKFNNKLLKEQIYLFIGYLDFFHKLHITYLKKLIIKLEFFNNRISDEINFGHKTLLKKKPEHNLSNNDIEKSIIDEIENLINVNSK